MRNRSFSTLTTLTMTAALMLPLCLTSAAGCSGESGETDAATGSGTGDETVVDYLWNTWGIRLTEFDVDLFDVDEEGSQVLFDDGMIEVEGLGTWEISTTTIVDPAAAGGQTSIFVANADLTEERYFLYDRVENYITIGDFTKGVAVAKNPDDTYEVWAFDGDAMDTIMTVDNGYEALKIVEEYNDFKEISPYILLTAIAVAHGPAPEPRISNAVSTSNLAGDTPVCDIFKEFCDCAACLVLDREGACDLCPEL